MITLTSSAVTHRGLVRAVNQDSVLVTDRLVAVADGLGGHAAGEIASGIAVDRLAALADIAAPTPEDVTDAIVDANRLINAEAQANPEHSGMGTTLCGVGVVTVGGSAHCIVFNVGDSRVYSYRAGGLEQVSVDHSEVQEMADAGQLSRADAARHPRRNVITRCLGSEPCPTPDLWVFPPGDVQRFLVCSDGLTTEVDDEDIARILARHPDPGPAASALLEQALSAGGRDNIAVIVVNLAVDPDAEPAVSDTSPRSRDVPDTVGDAVDS